MANRKARVRPLTYPIETGSARFEDKDEVFWVMTAILCECIEKNNDLH